MAARIQGPPTSGDLPAAPYAVHLADERGRFRWICFDLDSKHGDPLPDLATLLRWVEEARLAYVVAASGSAGGRHVWVTAGTSLDAVLVASIATAAAKRLPTLDHGLLKNPAPSDVGPRLVGDAAIEIVGDELGPALRTPCWTTRR